MNVFDCEWRQPLAVQVRSVLRTLDQVPDLCGSVTCRPSMYEPLHRHRCLLSRSLRVDAEYVTESSRGTDDSEAMAKQFHVKQRGA